MQQKTPTDARPSPTSTSKCFVLTFRADLPLVRAVKARAQAEDRSESSVMRAAVRAFVADFTDRQAA